MAGTWEGTVAGRDIPSISVAVVDDLDRDMRHLLALLNRFQEENSVSFAVSTFTDGAALLDANVHDLDMILLDIQMAGIDGMKAAEALRAAGSDAVIIFVTKTAQYAVRGYSVQALGYLVKPASYLAFETEIRRALTQLSTRARSPSSLGVAIRFTACLLRTSFTGNLIGTGLRCSSKVANLSSRAH